ncbi:hypothetical protein EV361DRAFT_513972 [Lentinula raphanica]|nr:hypothetical protein EV361DRAFT_513972 [Lentinula raphanica]
MYRLLEQCRLLDRRLLPCPRSKSCLLNYIFAYPWINRSMSNSHIVCRIWYTSQTNRYCIIRMLWHVRARVFVVQRSCRNGLTSGIHVAKSGHHTSNTSNSPPSTPCSLNPCEGLNSLIVNNNRTANSTRRSMERALSRNSIFALFSLLLCSIRSRCLSEELKYEKGRHTYPFWGIGASQKSHRIVERSPNAPPHLCLCRRISREVKTIYKCSDR